MRGMERVENGPRRRREWKSRDLPGQEPEEQARRGVPGEVLRVERSRALLGSGAVEREAQECGWAEVGIAHRLVFELEVEGGLPELDQAMPPMNIELRADHVGVVPDELVPEGFPVRDEGRGKDDRAQEG